MSEDMPGSSSWKYLSLSSASSRISSLKGYISNHNHHHHHYRHQREFEGNPGASSSSSSSSAGAWRSSPSPGPGVYSPSNSGIDYTQTPTPNMNTNTNTNTSTNMQSGSAAQQQQQQYQLQQQYQHQQQSQQQQQYQDSPRQSWRAWAGQKIRAHAAKRAGQENTSGIRNANGNGNGNVSTELVNVFPGWAVRRYHPLQEGEGESRGGEQSQSQGPRPFDLEVFVSGYAITHRAPENMSRAQRGFLRLAKGFASLPKIIDPPSSSLSSSSQPSASSSQTTASLNQLKLTPSTEALLAQITLPPRPSEISDDFDVDKLERELRRAKATDGEGKAGRGNGTGTGTGEEGQEEGDGGSSSASSSASSSRLDLNARSQNRAAPPAHQEAHSHAHTHNPAAATQEMIRRLHANLERRLQPFWSSVLPGRVVRVGVWAAPRPAPGSGSAPGSSSSSSFSSTSLTSPSPSPSSSHNQSTSTTSASTSTSTSAGGINRDINRDIHQLLSDDSGPLASREILTAADGSFQVRMRVPWEELCLHPKALHIAFGEGGETEEDEVLVVVSLIPNSNSSASSSAGAGSSSRSSSAFSSPSSSRLSLNSQNPQFDDSNPNLTSQTPPPLQTPTAILTTPLTHAPLRAISDIDDTIKHSGILSGARAVFHNVFVKELRDNVIPGMGEWYAGMWSRGVRFHYVSNGPFELLPVLNEFLEISQLPPGSIKLRSYAGRSLFNGLLSAPAARKRAGVVDILDAFPESRFLLIGDSGEQDMELYADIARERPHQIVAIYIRDADAFTYNGPEPLEDPTGWKAVASGAAGTRPSGKPLVHPPAPGPASGSASGSGPVRSDSVMTASSSSSATSTSTTSNWERYDYGAVGETNWSRNWRDNGASGQGRRDSDTPLEPPRPQFWSESSGAGGVGGARQSQHFGGAMSAEPEPLIDFGGSSGDDVTRTPTTASSARMGSTSQDRQQSATPTQQHTAKLQRQPQYVTEPPPPTPPPSSSTTFPYSHAQTYPYRSQHPSSSTSSLSSSASTSTTNLNKHQYGYFSGNNTSTPNASTNTNTNANSNLYTYPSKKGSTSSGSSMSENEKKRHELQLRVWRARTQIPPGILLRVFRDPMVECAGEAGEVLDREGV